MEATITIRIDQATKAKLEKAAKKEGRSLSNYLRRLLEQKSSPAS